MSVAEPINHRVHLTYPLDKVKEPILYHLVMDFNLKPNVYRANINVHEGGFLDLEITGTEADMERAVNWLESLGVTVTETE